MNRQTRLAMHLMTLMLALFGVMVWVPDLIAHPQAHFNWSECALTFLVTGSSYGMGLELQQKNTTLADRFGLVLTEFAAHDGSFPVALAGPGVIGSVAVSGLPQRADHELVVEALCGELGCNYAELRLPDA